MEELDERTLETLKLVRDPELVSFGHEVRRARLYTEIFVGDERFEFSAVGARGCATQSLGIDDTRKTAVYNLSCDLTFFGAEDTPLGPVRIIQDPRIENRGWIYLRRGDDGRFDLPGLSYFNQHLIFHVGDRWFYYPAAWQVVSAITAWPPEGHQYHHLEPDTPIFDFVTREPNVARKGISTIWIEGPLDDGEEERIRAEVARELDLIAGLPASKMTPEDITPGQLVIA